MSDVHITVAVTAHAETVVAGPTMQSAERAIRTTEAEGFNVERLIGLDSPSHDCRAFFNQPAFAGWTKLEFEFGDQGRVRNALAESALGRWVAFLDADDLFSENWLAVAAQCIEKSEKIGKRVVVHPEINWFFDRSASILTKTMQEDWLFSPYYFYFLNYYDALCMAPRAAYIEVPYSPRDIKGGFAYEDWQWNIETMATGWQHIVAKNTIIFKRRREMSQTIRASQRGTLIRDIEPMAIDRIANLGHITEEEFIE